MNRNYLSLAVRIILRRKLFAAINITGLSIGICAAIAIGAIVHFDLSFDDYHPGSDRIFRVVTNVKISGEPYYNEGVTAELADAAAKEVTGIELTVPFHEYGYNTKVIVPANGREFKRQEDIVLAGRNYFDLFSYRWLAGSAAAFDPGNHVVLTRKQASDYFPGLAFTALIGRELIYDDSVRVRIAGIVDDPPANTDLRAKAFISLATLKTMPGLRSNLGFGMWTNTNGSSQLFLRLKPGASEREVARLLNGLLAKYREKTPHDGSFVQTFVLQPLNDIHFNEKYAGDSFVSKSSLSGLAIIGVFLLLLGCINFINMTTAQAGLRAKEIGVRKTMGGRRNDILRQFMTETLLLTLAATAIAVGLFPLSLKWFSDFIPAGVTAAFLGQPFMIAFIVVLVIIVSLSAGIYPGLVLSSFKPVSVIRNVVSGSGVTTRSSWIRKTLTTGQFLIAQVLIMGTLMVSKQISHMLNKDPGFRKDAIVFIRLPWSEAAAGKKNTMVRQLKAMPNIGQVSLGGAPPASKSSMSSQFTFNDGKKSVQTDVQLKQGDENYLSLYRIPLVAGESLTAADTNGKALINETYARILGFQDPRKAIGEFVNNESSGRLRITGVLADFHQRSLHTRVKPMIFYNQDPDRSSVIHIALPQDRAGWNETLTGVERRFKALYPEGEFSYQFLDEQMAAMYDNETRTSTLLKWATGLSVFISCIGVFGLAVYTINLRTREIGIRKVLGATVAQIVSLLSREMTGLVLLASLIAIPIVWLAMDRWLQNFADRSAVSWWVFAGGSAAMLLIALLVSGLQTVKAALANPTSSLRSE